VLCTIALLTPGGEFDRRTQIRIYMGSGICIDVAGAASFNPAMDEKAYMGQ